MVSDSRDSGRSKPPVWRHPSRCSRGCCGLTIVGISACSTRWLPVKGASYIFKSGFTNASGSFDSLNRSCHHNQSNKVQGVPKRRTNKTNKKGQTWQACQHSKVVRNGQPSCFWPFGTLWGSNGHFWIISAKNQFVTPKGQSRVSRRCFWAKNNFLFEIVQRGPDGPKRVPNGQKQLGWPFRTTLECWQACHVWPFLFVLLIRFLRHVSVELKILC